MKTKKVKYLVWGYYGLGNLGDDLMLKVIARRIRDKHPDALIYVRCRYAPKVENIVPVEIRKELVRLPVVAQAEHFCRLLTIIFKIDNLVIGGGTLFLDRGKHNPSMLILCAAVFLSRIFSKKVYVVGVGVDKLTFPINLKYLKYILESSEFISVRDNFSFNAASNLIGRQIIKKTSDILFDGEFTKSLWAHKGHEKKYIILALYDYNRMWGITEKKDLFYERSLQLIVDILERWGREYKIVLCALQHEEGGYDYEFLTDLYKSVILDHPDFSNKIIVKYIDREDQIKEYIGQAVFAISSRYHALVLCAILGVPFMGIEVETKIREICKEYGMPLIKESEYLKYDASFYKLDKLKIMAIKEETVAQNIKESEENFAWIK